MKRLSVVASVLAMAAVVLSAGLALADQGYHTSRLPLSLTAAGDAAGHTLRNGWVVNIHPNGPVVGAIEEYHLNGAKPDTDYAVVWDMECAGFEVPTGIMLHTNGNGDAQARQVISRQWQIDNGFTDVSFNVRWLLKASEVIAYRTPCEYVYID